MAKAEARDAKHPFEDAGDLTVNTNGQGFSLLLKIATAYVH